MVNKGGRMPDQQTALEERNQKILATARRNFTNLNTAEDILQFAHNISQRGEHLRQLSIEALDKGLTLKYEPMLPPITREQDRDPINLRDLWLEALKITGKLGSYTKRILNNRGYLGSYQHQVSKLSKIGTLGFVILGQHNALQYSAEYIMYHHFPQLLSDQQISRIKEVLTEAGMQV